MSGQPVHRQAVIGQEHRLQGGEYSVGKPDTQPARDWQNGNLELRVGEGTPVCIGDGDVGDLGESGANGKGESEITDDQIGVEGLHQFQILFHITLQRIEVKDRLPSCHCRQIGPRTDAVQMFDRKVSCRDKVDEVNTGRDGDFNTIWNERTGQYDGANDVCKRRCLREEENTLATRNHSAYGIVPDDDQLWRIGVH